jgi:glutathione peroxidase
MKLTGLIAGGIVMSLFSVTSPASGAGAHNATAFDFQFENIDGGRLPLAAFRGSALLVVNTASRCGFTGQYDALQRVWADYRDRGLIVLGVPSNDFGGQEPGSEADIKSFCVVNFDVDFPMTAKTRVRGEDAHPFYRWAARQAGPLGVPRWNFHKYLVAPDGRLDDWFATTTSPDARRVREAIESVLPVPAPVAGASVTAGEDAPRPASDVAGAGPASRD